MVWNPIVVEYILEDILEVFSRYALTYLPDCICQVSNAGSNRIVVGCDDGCVRLLDATGSTLSNIVDLQNRSEPLPEAGTPSALKTSLGNECRVAVLLVSGRVITATTKAGLVCGV